MSKSPAGTVLVTGGAGFIGSHLVPALLRAGYRVRVLDTLSQQVHGAPFTGAHRLGGNDAEFVRGSVASPHDVREALAGVDAIVHLAAETGTGQSMYEIARYSEANVQGTAVLLDSLANRGDHGVRRLVLASSRSVYGEGAYVCAACSPERRAHPGARTAAQLAKRCWELACEACGAALAAVPTREDDRLGPASIYAATKCAQEDLVRISCSSLGIGYALLRLQNVYGEGQSLNNPYTGILSIFSTRVRRGLFLPVFEDGLETRDFVHVEDVTRAIVAALGSIAPANRAINVGSGVRTSIADVARQLSLAFGSAPDIVVTGQYRLGDIRHNSADIACLCAVLDCPPRIGLPEGLRRFAAWVATQPLPADRLDAASAELEARGLMG